MNREHEEDLHAELGYRSAGRRELGLRDWQSLQGEPGEPAPTPRAFKRLVWRLQAKKYWALKAPAVKARFFAYRKQWAKEHSDQVRAGSRASHKRWRADPKNHAAEIAEKRAKRAAARQTRREATVYCCAWCGATWSPIGRLPSRPPKWCSIACKSRSTWADPEKRARELKRRAEHRAAGRQAS